MHKPFLIRTQYYNKPWTWLKRGFEFTLATGLLYWISVLETPGEYTWIKYALFLILSIYIFVRPVDELALSGNALYYIRKSAIAYFTRVEKYDLSQIKSIGCGGLSDTDTPLSGRARAQNNRLEIVFKDNSSKAIDIKIYKQELTWIVRDVLQLLKGDSA